ncbi:MAG: hypothetical protein HDT14_00420 [Oscillibacter sp.]|nr:hypothetical protein [Oscillibacter sp.]
MKIGISRITAALLVLALALGLTGCGKDGEQKKADLVFPSSLYYAVEEMPQPVESGELAGCCTDRESIWYLVIPEEDAEPVLCRVPLDGGEAEVLTEYQAPMADGQPAVGYVGPIVGGDGTLWVWEQFFVPGTETSQFSHTFHMRQLDPATGRELSVTDITAAMDGMNLQTLNGIVVDGEGTIFLADQKHIAAIDSQGQTLYTLKAKLPGTFFSSGAGGSLALLPDGTIGVLTVQSKDERTVQIIDRETRDWTKQEYSIHKEVNRIYPGSGACAFYYISGGIVYGIAPGEDIPLRLLSWSSAQLDESDAVRCFALLDDGQAAALSSIHTPGTGWYDDTVQAVRLLPTDEPPAGMKVRLVYGAIGTNFLTQEKIAKYNRGNKNYYIEYRDYSEGLLGWTGEKNTQVYQNALARLYADIAAGRCPDILDESLPLDTLARQGALEDLWPWIDGDPAISREGLMAHVLECLEVDGKLPRVCAGFEIETAVASAAVAGDRAGWTMEEMLDAFGGETPEFYFALNNDLSLIYTMFYRFDRQTTLYDLVNMNLSRFVNMETGECAFDSEDFKSLLRLAGSGEDVAETSLNLDDPYVLRDLGISGQDASVLSGIEPCRVFPWEGRPLLCARTLADAKDLVVDDVLFGGRESLTADYDQRLWDAEIIYSFINNNDVELIRTRYDKDFNQVYWAHENGFEPIQYLRSGFSDTPLAGDYQVGAADGNVYASYVGFPTSSGAGSSFTIRQGMGISASSGAKEGAWAFVRGQLLPNGNASGYWVATGEPSNFDGFPINRETFDARMRIGMEYWTDPYSGEVFTDANGDPVEFTPAGIGVGKPGDVVLMAYLFAPSEAQMERFWRLYESTEQITGRNDAILDIVMEQADAYFAGDKSLEETVQLIQNRASLYVNEHR